MRLGKVTEAVQVTIRGLTNGSNSVMDWQEGSHLYADLTAEEKREYQVQMSVWHASYFG